MSTTIIVTLIVLPILTVVFEKYLLPVTLAWINKEKEADRREAKGKALLDQATRLKFENAQDAVEPEKDENGNADIPE